MKNKLAKLLALLLAAALLTACMTGCTGKTEQPAKAEATEKAEPAEDSTPVDEEITLTFWHTYGDAEEAQFKDVVLPLWEKAHPNIKIDAVRQDGGQFHEMIVTSFGTGMSPDVARVDIANIAAYAKQGGLVALMCHEGYQRAACNYYYAHFTHPEMARVEDEDAAMSLLAEKRRLSLVSYNLDEADPTDPITYLPKQFHLPGSEFNTILRTALDCYNAREEHYKRRTAALLHSFFLEVAHEHLLARGAAQGKKLKKSEVVAERLLHYLNENYTRPLSSQEIEDVFEMNFDYMNRAFSKLTDAPIFTYLNTLRIYNAQQLIATTDLPFQEIAYLVGIDDRYYFSKLFRKKTGMSPSEYYKEVRNRGDAERL